MSLWAGTCRAPDGTVHLWLGRTLGSFEADLVPCNPADLRAIGIGGWAYCDAEVTCEACAGEWSEERCRVRNAEAQREADRNAARRDWIVRWCHPRLLRHHGVTHATIPPSVSEVRQRCKAMRDPTDEEYAACREWVLSVRPGTECPE